MNVPRRPRGERLARPTMARLSRMARLAAGFTIFTSTMNVATARTQEQMLLVFETVCLQYMGLELWGGERKRDYT